jgi:hypothetical protein
VQVLFAQIEPWADESAIPPDPLLREFIDGGSIVTH